MTEPAALPPPTPEKRLRQLVAVLGSREAALRVVDALGGQTVYIPHHADRSGLPDDLGRAIVDRLISVHAGNYLIVPLAKAWRAQCYKARGLSHSAIAAKLGMTESGVYRTLRLAGIAGNVEPDPTPSRQLDLGF